jgi:hypothetical protein
MQNLEYGTTDGSTPGKDWISSKSETDLMANGLDVEQNDSQQIMDPMLEKTKWKWEELEKTVVEKQRQVEERGRELEEKQREIGGLRRELMELRSRDHKPRLSAQNQEALFDLSNELKTVHRRKYDLEGEVGELRRDLQSSRNRQEESSHEIHRLHEELGHACHIRRESEEKCRGMEGERTEMERRIAADETRIRWLDEQMEQKNSVQAQLRELEEFKKKVNLHLAEAFIVRKEVTAKREDSGLAIWKGHAEEEFVRTWFELDTAADTRSVGLVGSFFNWECALLCTLHPHGKWGVWVDVPRGRHEFCFLVDGTFLPSLDYDTCPTAYGSTNNVRHVE